MQLSLPQASKPRQIGVLPQLSDCQPNHCQGIVVPTLEERAKKGIGTMAQFSGQTGSLEKHGNNWTVVYRYRDPGGVKWRKKRTTICPISGPGALGPLERERRKIAMLEEAGVNAEETLRAQITEDVSGSITFQQQADAWLYAAQTRKRDPIEAATAKGYRSYIHNHLNPILGELPLSAVDNDVLKRLVQKLHDKELGPKTISSIVETGKLVMASLKVNGEEVYKRTWDNEYIDLPVVDPEDQNSEAFTPEEMTHILDTAFQTAAKNPAYMLALSVSGLGLRIGEALAIKVRDNIGCPHCKVLRPEDVSTVQRSPKIAAFCIYGRACTNRSLNSQRQRMANAKWMFRSLWLQSSGNISLANHPAHYCSRRAAGVLCYRGISTAIGYTRFWNRLG